MDSELEKMLTKMKEMVAALPPPPWFDTIAVSPQAYSQILEGASPMEHVFPVMGGLRLELEIELPEGYTLQKLRGKIVGVNGKKLPSDFSLSLNWTPRSAVAWLCVGSLEDL